MDFRSVTGVTISSASVNKISIGGIVVWRKNANKYKILKDNVLIDEITIADLVSRVQDGSAKTDYGVGTQIIIPYHDPFDNNNYNLPFNFGTFTAYGENKLGLQAHYAIPTVGVQYGTPVDNDSSKYCTWSDSYMYKWLNSYNTEHEISHKDYVNKKGFLGCLPRDFTSAMLSTSHGNASYPSASQEVSGKFFLPGAINSYAITGYSNKDAYYDMLGDGENAVWEYWRERIGTTSPQTNSGQNANRISYKIDTKQACNIRLPNIVHNSSSKYDSVATFNYLGMYSMSIASSTDVFSLPACVIG